MVSVVITTYKRPAKMLKRAVNSVIAQTFSDWELFVIDDTPPEFYEIRADIRNMLILINDHRIHYIQNKCNMGACYSRNVGLSLSHGEYIAFLDDDDEWLPEKISCQLDEFERCEEDVALVYCGGIKVNDTTNEESLFEETYKKGNAFNELLADNFIGSTSIPLIKTDILKKVGGFDEKMPAAQDYDLWLRIAEKYRISCVEKPLFKYHIHGNECITADVNKKIQGISRLERKWKEQIDCHPQVKYIREMKMAVLLVRDRRFHQSLSTWFKAVKIFPLNISNNIKRLLMILYYCFAGAKNEDSV